MHIRRGGDGASPEKLQFFWRALSCFGNGPGPALLPALIAPYALLIASLLGVWRYAPAWLHWATLVLAALMFAAILRRHAASFRTPTRREAQERLERDGGAEHNPLQALDDHPFEGEAASSPLWLAHRRASAERARKARLKGVRANIAARDPWGLRFTAAGALIVAFIAAGADWRSRLAGALTPTPSGGSMVADLWIEPPAHAGKAPIYLMRAGEMTKSDEKQVNAPAGSRLVAQINGRGKPRLRFKSETDETAVAFDRDGAAARGELTLAKSGLLHLRLGTDKLNWPIAVIPDAAPSVAFTTSPEPTEEGRLGFAFSANDDYGLAAARLELRLDPDQERPLDSPEFDEAALAERRVIGLDGAAGAPGERAMTLDLQADPWAGLQVLARIIVVDGAAQTGTSREVAATLPTRAFFNPLAKSVLEQRQTLAVAAKDWRRAGRSFDAITLAPDVFFEDSTEYLLLRSAFWRVMRQNGDGFADAVEEFWPLALQLEDEALELARQRLEAAEEALRQALERGASDEEIERLVEELRAAMNDYLSALAQSGQSAGQTPRGAQQLNQSELDQMLDAIRDLAQQGAAGAARQMLSDLENLLNNLRLTQGGQGGEGGEGQSDSAAGDVGELIGRQRELADESFQRGQSYGESGEDLAEREGALGGDLDELIDELQQSGDDPTGDASRALGRARNEMRDAQNALRGGDFDAATSAMERAISNLREGAEGLAREEMRQANEGEEGAEGGDVDPLGRPTGSARGDGVETPEETDAGRARAVIDELRRRLGEPGRSEEEIDYLERLLERF